MTTVLLGSEWSSGAHLFARDVHGVRTGEVSWCVCWGLQSLSVRMAKIEDVDRRRDVQRMFLKSPE